ncbi:N-acetyl-1-D-myo-inositol-2-amino-2-deoxy-alpha-D-glucopyranoside deacetylase [Angustibacter sp. McL0619]|uniref:N-acetyl-1-D-myo-inositol-2-amino-2-deoxy-alpha- D-glucopyranoside deacetylase n=1 Tax=Angustibacter sp. McL0619 TaxID=3415676 RepID=UPI003CF65AA3
MSEHTFGDEPAAGAEPARRLVLVHAHPDDETLTTGITMAKYVAEGAGVTLVTCTLGDEGEVIPSDLRHLASDADDVLGPHRALELAAAMRALGVTDHRVLGEGRWRDSGMVWSAPGVAAQGARVHPRAFVRADPDVAAGLLADVLREVRPQVVVTYDPMGGYGHPDHVMAHRVTMRGVELARQDGALPGWQVRAVHWVQEAHSWARAERRAVLAAAQDGRLPAGMLPPDYAEHPPAVVPDDQLDVVVEAPEHLPAVTAALTAHATQVCVEPPWFALSNDVAHRLSAREGFRRVFGPPAAVDGQVADDLFAGLELPER